MAYVWSNIISATGDKSEKSFNSSWILKQIIRKYKFLIGILHHVKFYRYFYL